MKYGITNCSFGYKPRDFDGPYLTKRFDGVRTRGGARGARGTSSPETFDGVRAGAEHRGSAYVNANILRWHRLSVPAYDKPRRVLEHFMG